MRNRKLSRFDINEELLGETSEKYNIRKLGSELSEDEIGIIGGAGFIGSALARYLSDQFKIRILDVKPVSKDLESRTNFLRCDIRNYNELKEKLKGLDLVIHTAIIQIPLINKNKRLGYEVNVKGTQNVCEAVHKSDSIKGFLLTSSWHVFGEREFRSVIDEEFGFRPDKIEKRAKFYAITKIAQETIVRIYDDLSAKILGVIRIGTVLGEGMPEKTAANIFITEGLKGKTITPFKHSMYRPMLYVDINDVCRGFGIFAKKILDDDVEKNTESLAHVINLMWPKSITILDLATIVRDSIIRESRGKTKPEIKIIDHKKQILYPSNKEIIIVNWKRAESFLRLKKLKSPPESIARIISQRLASQNTIEQT